MRVAFSPEARSDLEDIHNYVSDLSPAAASRLAIQLLAACDSLEEFPERGRPGIVPGTRELTTVRPYIIVYRIDGPALQIVRVWHRLRDRTAERRSPP
jgi:addiction module RelE/StbE family toxin